ncbi:MAG: glycosyltransferase family 4 protein [Ignavibacteria bacterium]|jgi:glycosyltransferase involved in cell wall biosynthesis|nr:glycosyltransferase family 4 protein [Ignavibacteria bacterium]
MNILAMNWQCTKNPLSGGAEVHFQEIFKRIVAMGHSVTLLACTFEGCKSEEIVDGIKIIRKGGRSLFNYTVRTLYKSVAYKEHFDIVIDDINKVPFYSPLFVKEPLLAISHHFFGANIFHETNFFAGSYVYFSEALIKYVYKNTPFAVVSQSTLDEFISMGFNPKNFTIIYNAFDKNNFPLKVSEKPAYPVISYFGRLKKYKSVDHLFYAFANVTKKYPNAELKIIGKGDFRDFLEKLAKELGIEKNVRFLGFVSEEAKSVELSTSYCVVNTSIKEGWGITNLEANACGTLVISSDVPGLRDSVKNGVSGLLYKYGDIDDLTDAMLQVIDNIELRNKLSLGGLEWANSFSWDKSAAAMLEKCEEVIAAWR